jgi:hypothetical protein
MATNKRGKRKRKKLDAKDKAQRAVKAFEEARTLLREMKENFETEYPDAFAALEDIRMQEDKVTGLIERAIPLIREARTSIGDFRCTLKTAKAKYDGVKFKGLLAELSAEEIGAIMLDLISEGHVKEVNLDVSAAEYFATHPQNSKHFNPAWVGPAEMTPSVRKPTL